MGFGKFSEEGNTGKQGGIKGNTGRVVNEGQGKRNRAKLKTWLVGLCANPHIN